MSVGSIKKPVLFLWLSIAVHAVVLCVFSLPFFKGYTPPSVAYADGFMSVALESGGGRVKEITPVSERTHVSEPEPMSQPALPVSAPTPVPRAASSQQSVESLAPVVSVPSEVSSGGGGVTQKASPSYSENPKLHYPDTARRLRQQGTVLVNVWVSKEGVPTKVELDKSSGYSLLDRTALETVMRWKFNPKLNGNTPLESIVVIPIRFQLL